MRFITYINNDCQRESGTVSNLLYKIVLSKLEQNYKMIGFLIPNTESNPLLYQFVASVDAIEKATSIDFFSN